MDLIDLLLARPCRLAAVATLTLWTTAPALAQPGAASPAASAPSSAPMPAVGPAPGTPPAFAVVTRDAKRSEGLFDTWQKDDKVWIELKPEDFGKPFFLAPKLTRGIGESGLYAGLVFGRWGSFGRSQIVEFKRVHHQVQLLARNSDFMAAAGTPSGRAVNLSFSPSLLGSAAVASQPHPERKTVLVDLASLFLSDMQGLSLILQRVYRQQYSFDPRNSSIAALRGKPDLLVLETLNHYLSPSIALAQPPLPGAPPTPGPQPTTPTTLPDVRSLFLGVHYSLGALPAQPMAARRADPRVGTFNSNVSDYTDDLARTPRQRLVNRWRLEKKDPLAAMSEPVKPITFWLDRTMPMEYRQAISEGILEWNKAFERIGFKDAVVVKVQPDDADFDTLDLGVASVRWLTSARASFGAIGPSQVDPRTGEILDADISFESLSSRSLRTLRAQVLGSSSAADWAQRLQASDAITEGRLAVAGYEARHQHGPNCQFGDMAAEQMSYAMDVLAARGDLNPDGPQARQFVLDYLRGVSAHEVGHTLGLRHNFRSSRIYTLAQLADPVFTAANGIAGSVMEYPAINLPPPGVPMERHGVAFRGGLGPYDYWAIEYAYKPLPKETEAAELQRIAARSGEPALAFGTDEDQFLGIDPESLHFDLGDDPVAFAKLRLAIARDLIARQESRTLDPAQDYSVLRRVVSFAVTDIGRAAGILARQIGGVRTLRDHPNTGRDPLLPATAAVQRAALDTLASGVLASDSFKLSARLQRRLAPDFGERGDALYAGETGVQTDYSVNAAVIELQRTLLAQLMSDGVAVRILDSQDKADKPAEAFKLSELHSRITREVWREVWGEGAVVADLAPLRRELQREHLNRLTSMLLRPTTASRAETRSLYRAQSQELLARLTVVVKRPGLSVETRAHLQDAIESLTQGLQAKAQRAAV